MDSFAHQAGMFPPKFPNLSTIGIPTLETIAGSAAPTPSLNDADGGADLPPTPPELSLYQPATSPRSSSLGLPPAGSSASPTPRRMSLAPSIPGSHKSDLDLQSVRTAPSDYLTPLEGPASRRSSIAVSGSYFPSNAKAGPSSKPYSSPSGSSTPADRPRPAPLSIPLGTPDEPLFSAYPETGLNSPGSPTRAGSRKGKASGFTFPLKPAFALAQPSRRRGKDRDERPGVTADDSPTSTSRPRTRRRASTYSAGSPPATAPLVEKERKRLPLRLKPAQHLSISPTSSLKGFRRRRVSVHGHEHEEYRDGTWDRMATEEARRFDPKHVPFSYQDPSDQAYMLQSVSTVATVRPLAGSPHISPRRSSLASTRNVTPSRVMLGLTNMSDTEPQVEIVIPDDLAMPHDPPPRRSSLDYGASGRLIDPKVMIETEMPKIIPPDHRSVLSASLTGTDTSASAEFYSNSPSTKEHPLSSATTSLSRSAKSGKEELSDEKDAALAAIRLQRSLEWEARQTRHRRRLEKRRMILLELVETEVAYMGDLTILVQVYLPQLYALPSISERTADLISRNARELLNIHLKLAGRMVEVLKEEKLGYELGPEPMMSSQIERASRKLASLFVDQVSAFTAYNEFCAGSIAAATLVRHISQRPDYDSYERRCQIISAAQPHAILKDLLEESSAELPNEPLPVSTSLPTMRRSLPSSPTGTPSNRSRLHFRDFLIMPIQRICRYPLLLNQLLGAASSPSPVEEREHPQYPDEVDGDYDTGVDVERALGAMRGVAQDADEARRMKENEIKSATIIERLEPHPALTPSFLKSLGQCRLIGSLDVLHHHPIIAPLVAPVKVKYFGAFLYRGYLILAKVKKGKVYEAKHFLPLEVFELIDITEGFLPHSIRLSLRDHNFDLAASCETEKEVWAAALCQARDESTVPPFELPASVSPFAARSRRMSAAMPPDFGPAMSTSASGGSISGPSASAAKRHTLAVGPDEITFPYPPVAQEGGGNGATPEAPLISPIRTSFGFTPERTGRPSTILLRRASASQRLLVDRMLIDVFSESCAHARSKAQMHHALFLPDVPTSELRDGLAIRDSTMLRRRRSFLDSKHARQTSFDIAFTGEIRGSVMPVRQTRSHAGKRRSQPAQGTKKFVVGTESSTEVDRRYASADETATGSDFGTMTRGQSGYFSRAPSSGVPSRSHSPTNFDYGSTNGTVRGTSAGPTAAKTLSRQSSIIGLAKRKSLTNIRKSIDAASESTSNFANMLTLNRRKTASSNNLARRPNTPSRAKSMPASPVTSPNKNAPPVPPMPSSVGGDNAASGAMNAGQSSLRSRPRQSLSAHTSPARRSVSIAHFSTLHSPGQTPDGDNGADEVTVWTHGRGYTNQMPIVPDRGTPWSTLKRSMSFMRDHHSNSSMSAMPTAATDGGRPARPATLRRQSTEYTARSHGSNMSSGMSETFSGEGDDEAEMGGSADGYGGSGAGERASGDGVGESPRRRRSVRMFQTLSRFTPI